MVSKKIIGGVGLAVLVGIIAFAVIMGGTDQFATAGECKDVFCDDYEFVCCGLDDVVRDKTDYFSYNTAFTCNYDVCELKNIDFAGAYAGTVYVIKEGMKAPAGASCWMADGGWFYSDYIKCSGESRFTGSTLKMTRGEKIYHQVGKPLKVYFTYTGFNQRLAWCGDGACDAGQTGIKVSGSDGCTFTPKGKIYDDSGRLIDANPSISYVVPEGSCVLSKSGRHICANECEACSSDSECKSGHQYVYNGYGAECSTGLLKLYGCRPYGKQISNTDLLGDEANDYLGEFGKRCEVIDTVNVECCDDSTCGSNEFCDKNTFRCVQEKECDYDSDCGTQTIKDRELMALKKPVCVSGSCSYEITNVECLYDEDCPTGYFCDTDYTCKQSVTKKQECPYECCEDMSGYWDKTCPSNSPVCCPAGSEQEFKCVTSEEGCGGGAYIEGCMNDCMGHWFTTEGICHTWCDYGIWIKMLIGVIAGTITFAFVSNIVKKQKVNKKYALIIPLILALAIFGLTFLFWWLVVIGVLIALLIFIIYKLTAGRFKG